MKRIPLYLKGPVRTAQ